MNYFLGRMIYLYSLISDLVTKEREVKQPIYDPSVVDMLFKDIKDYWLEELAADGLTEEMIDERTDLWRKDLLIKYICTDQKMSEGEQFYVTHFKENESDVIFRNEKDEELSAFYYPYKHGTWEGFFASNSSEDWFGKRETGRRYLLQYVLNLEEEEKKHKE